MLHKMRFRRKDLIPGAFGGGGVCGYSVSMQAFGKREEWL